MDWDSVAAGICISLFLFAALAAAYFTGQAFERNEIKRYGCEAYLKAQGEGK